MLHVCLSLVLTNEAKQNVHVLKSAALSLLDKKDDKRQHAAAEAAKHDECAPADVVDGSGRDFRDDKVEQPLRGGGETDTVFTETCREDLTS